MRKYSLGIIPQPFPKFLVFLTEKLKKKIKNSPTPIWFSLTFFELNIIKFTFKILKTNRVFRNLLN